MNGDIATLFTSPNGLPPDLVIAFLDALVSDTVAGDIFRLMNAAFLAVASARVFYLIVLGTMHTASSGDVLGEKGSITYVAPRIVLGMVILVPLASGWSVGQLVVIQAARWGVGLGGNIWESVQTALPRVTAQRLANAAGDADIRRRAIVAIEQSVCAHMVVGNLQIQGQWVAEGNSRVATSFPRSVAPKAVCGAWDFPDANAPNLPPGVATVLRAHRTALVEMANASWEIAGRLLDDWHVSQDDLNRLVTTYQQTIRDAVSSVPPPPILRTSWSNAGTRWHDVARDAAARAEAYNAFPIATAIDWHVAGGYAEGGWLWGRRGDVENTSRIAAAREALSLALRGVDDPAETERLRYAGGTGGPGQGVAGVVAPGEAVIGRVPSTTADDTSGLMGRVLTALRERIGVLALDGDQNESPIGRLAALGQSMLHGAWAAIGALTVGGTLLGSAATVLSTLLAPAVIAMLVAGTSLAYVVPLAPYAAWALGVLGYVMLIVVSLVAAPVWGIAHLRLGEATLAPQQSHSGYVTLVRILVTPAVMVATLYLGTLILEFFARYLLLSFRGAFDSVTAGQSLPSLFWGGVAGTIFLVGLLLYGVHAVLNLVRHAASEVMQVVSGGVALLRVVDGAEHVSPSASMPGLGMPAPMGRRSKATKSKGGSE